LDRCLNALARKYISKVKEHCVEKLIKKGDFEKKWLIYFE